MSTLSPINILGAQHVATPPNFADREALVMAWGEHGPSGEHRSVRCYAAAIGACCGLGRMAGASLAKSKYDVLAYGGEVYSWLRERGATTAEIIAAATPILESLGAALFPRESEVAAAAGFSGAVSEQAS